MFKSVLRFVGLCLFLIFTSGNVWAGTLPTSDPCYNYTYVGPGGGNISCNDQDDTFGKCYKVSANKCEYWCKQPHYFRLVNSTTITSSSQITTNMGWTCTGGTNITSLSCGSQATSYDGQTYYKSESYLDCRKLVYTGTSDHQGPRSGYSNPYVEFKLDPEMDFTCGNSSYGFDIKAQKGFNPYCPGNSYPSWILSRRLYNCGPGYRINGSAQFCNSSSSSTSIGRISGSSCSTSSSVLSAQPYCNACANGTYNAGYTSNTYCGNVPKNSTANSDKTGFLCNAGFYAYDNAKCLRCPYRDIAFTADVTSPVGATRVSECYYPGNSGGGTDDGTGTYTYGGNCSFDSDCTSCPMNLTFLGENCNADLPGYIEYAARSICTESGSTGESWGRCVEGIMETLGEVCPMQNVAQGVYSMSCGCNNYDIDDNGYSLMDLLKDVITRFPSGMNCQDSGVSIWVD